MDDSTEKNISAIKIAATYIGTIVGAGFASGQEVLQFFSVFGIWGIWGILLATILFFFAGYIILNLGNKLQAKSYLNVVQYTNGKIFGTVIDIIITVVLFGAFAAMIAGAGAIFKEQFYMSPLIGTTIMAIVCLVTVLKGISGVINAISYVVPILIVSILFITLYNFITNPLTTEKLKLAAEFDAATPNWFISAVLYVSFNLVLAIAILAPLGAQTSEKKTLFWGALFGGLGLGIGIVTINFSILTNIVAASEVEIPMILIAKNISPTIQLIFAVILFIAIYTTAVSNLYGFIARLNFISQKNQKGLIVITTLSAFTFSQLGFSTMVEYLYPLVGYAAVLLLIGLLYSWFFKRD
ncbi:hypothetical protein GH741_13220 [Aquibacillus halophilus]|uniref:Membrane protein YkvI n=1 Tax=Aquibacillus halophilus TaxID=930132 RepID=A0A6A8DR11_9BACI|nr:hypothetical protein [Aquibacillus halophilus]MRH43632.1 hypothetical protein [Aquibacillus halophilus]